KRVVARHIDGPATAGEIVDHQPLADLGLDSMRSINLLLELETEFGVVFPDEELTGENFRTVAAIESLVGRLRGTAAASWK
ncbi:MAG TPA: phosphopantetheine-binding protein, partial [Vicinamibacterales bacterium]